MTATDTRPLISRAVAALDAATLRELAAIADTRQLPPTPTAWQLLPVEAVDEALTMITAGGPPALGWWRAHLPAPTGDTGWPTPIPACDRNRCWQPWELTAAAVDLADEHVPPDVARDILAALAADHHLDARALADAFIALRGGP